EQQQQQQQQQQRVKSEARMRDVAAALEEAFAIMDALQAEKDAVLLEKKTREASYEAELRIRVAETEGLTATLQELREQVSLLRKHRSLHGSSQRYELADESPGNSEDHDGERGEETPKSS
ncbi:hypothetical protein, conserved, partial [Trypanosoma cruzi]